MPAIPTLWEAKRGGFWGRSSRPAWTPQQNPVSSLLLAKICISASCVSVDGQEGDTFPSRYDMHSRVTAPTWDPSTAFSVHTPWHSDLPSATRITHRHCRQHSEPSPACFSKCFHIPPTSQRLKNHMVRFNHRNKPFRWHGVSVLESSLLWKIFERNKRGKIYSGSGNQRIPSVMVEGWRATARGMVARVMEELWAKYWLLKHTSVTHFSDSARRPEVSSAFWNNTASWD